MNAKAQGIGNTVAGLLDYAAATDKLNLTATPITVEDAYGDEALVTLHACWHDGRDVEIRTTVAPDGTQQELQEVRYYGMVGMTEWFDLMDFEIDDFLHERLEGTATMLER